MVKKTLQRIVGSSKRPHTERAFAQLFSKHADALYRFIYWRVGGNEDVAKDMTSEVFTKAWERWEEFDDSFPKAWLYTIARNLVVDSYRKKSIDRLDESEELVDEGGSLEEQTDSVLQKERLHQAIAKLKPKSRQVVELRFMSGLSARETADIMDTTEENVRVLQFRALKELRNHYEKN